MQQVATQRLEIANNGNANAKGDQKSSNGSEFSQIFEQSRETQRTTSTSKQESAVANTVSSTSPQKNTQARTRNDEDNQAQFTENKARSKDVAANSNEKSEQLTKTESSSPELQSNNAEKEIIIRDPRSPSDSNNGNSETEVSETLSLESELQDLGDGDHNQWVNLLNQLLSKETAQGNGNVEEEFDDGGAAPDPYAVDVGQVIEEGVEFSSNKLTTKDLEEEIIITLPDEPVGDVFNQDKNIQNLLSGNVTQDTTAQEEGQDLEADLTNFSNDELNLSNEELRQLLEHNQTIKQELSNLLPQSSLLNEASNEGANEENIDNFELTDGESQVIDSILSPSDILESQMSEPESNTEISLEQEPLQGQSLSAESDVEQLLESVEELQVESPHVEADLQLDEDLTLLAQLLLDDQNLQNPEQQAVISKNNNAPVIEDAVVEIKANHKSMGLTAEQQNSDILKELETLLQSHQSKLAAAESLAARMQANNNGDKASADFIASLQAGIKEFKEQLKSGREPGIDLQSLVNDAMPSGDGQNAMKAMQEQLTSSLQQIASISSLARGIDQAEKESLVSTLQSTIQNNMNSAVRAQSDIASAAMEANKQGQLFQSQLDKAINIAKPEAAQQLAKQVQVMVNQKNMVAEIRLDPPDLGSMKINITMQGDTASVNIVVQSQQARDMLDQNTPRLREMLEEQGIQLGQSSVQEESSGDKEANQSQYAAGSTNHGDEESELEQSDVPRHVNVARPGGIDYFA